MDNSELTPSALVLPYFAYGSNMSESQMRDRRVPFTSRRAAHLPGYRLAFNKHSISIASPMTGVGNILVDPESTVHGIFYEGTTELSFSQLDIYECVQDAHYYRKVIEVLVNDDDDGGGDVDKASSENGMTSRQKLRTVRAVTYIACDDRVGDPANMRPTRAYLARLLQGEDLLPKWYVDVLRAVKCVD
jgi:hypothetical protein